jgi:hypothetical protein
MLAGVLCCAVGAVALGQDAPGAVAVVSAYEGPPRFVHLDALVLNMNQVAAVNYVQGTSKRGAYFEVALVGGGAHIYGTTMTESDWYAKAEQLVAMNPKP